MERQPQELQSNTLNSLKSYAASQAVLRLAEALPVLFDEPLPVVLEYGLKLQMARALVLPTASSVKEVAWSLQGGLRRLQQPGRPCCGSCEIPKQSHRTSHDSKPRLANEVRHLELKANKRHLRQLYRGCICCRHPHCWELGKPGLLTLIQLEGTLDARSTYPLRCLRGEQSRCACEDAFYLYLAATSHTGPHFPVQ